MIRPCLLVLALSSGLTARTAGAAPRWELGLDAGGVHTVTSDAVLTYLTRAGVSGLRLVNDRWAVGLFAEHRRALDTPAGTSYSFVDAGARLRLSLTRRLWCRLDLGWGWRHISVPGYASTYSGPMVGAAAGIDIVARERWSLGAAAVYRGILFPGAWEDHITDDAGPVLYWSWRW